MCVATPPSAPMPTSLTHSFLAWPGQCFRILNSMPGGHCQSRAVGTGDGPYPPSPGWGFEVEFCSDGGGDRCGPERREGGERRAAGGTRLQLARGWK